MVKADPKHDYYADLEVGRNASTDEIKQQFRNLAKKFHPDRNPGKESEFVPKFQAIQAAHEILGDKDQRSKYDLERRRLGYGFASHVPPTRPSYGYPNMRASYTQPTQPYAPKQPPTPDQNPYNPYQNPNARRQQKQYQTSQSSAYEYTRKPSTSGTDFYSKFKPPPGASAASTNTRGEAGNNAKAWRTFGPKQTAAASKPSPSSSSPDPNRNPFTASASASASDASATPNHPGVRRSFTTRSPRKSGFDPMSRDGMFEPAAPRTSSYINSRNERSNSYGNVQDAQTQGRRSESPSNGIRTTSTPRKAKFEIPSPNSDSSHTSNVSSASGVPLEDSDLHQPNVDLKTPQSSFKGEDWKQRFGTTPIFNPTPSEIYLGKSTSRSRSSPTRSKNSAFPPPPQPRPPSSSSAVPSHSNSSEPLPPTTPAGTKFPQEQWSSASFRFDPIPDFKQKKANQTGRPPTRGDETVKKTNNSDAQNFDGSTRASDSDIRSISSSPDAMEIDTPPHVSISRERPARTVTQPINHPDWQGAKPATTDPSQIPIAENNIPSAVPNAMPPPKPYVSDDSSPPPPTIRPTRPASKEPILKGNRSSVKSSLRSDLATSPAFNLSDLKDNLGANAGGGISNLSDLNTTLPFPSKPSAQHPKTLFGAFTDSSTPAPSMMMLQPPMRPFPPSESKRLTAPQWKAYSQQFSAYMGLWHQFEDRILKHVGARHTDAEKFGTGGPDIKATQLLEAVGEPQGGGIAEYYVAMKNDQKLLDTLFVARENHLKCLGEFIKAKDTIHNKGGFAPTTTLSG